MSKMFEKYKSSSDKIANRNLYKYVFYLFNFSGIFLDNHTKKNRSGITCNISIKFLNVFFNTLAVFYILLCISYFALYPSKSKMRTLVYILINATYFSFRIYLSYYLSHLYKITKRIYEISPKLINKRNSEKWVIIWIIIVLTVTIYMIVELTRRIFNDNKVFEALYFGYSIKNVHLKFCLALIYSLDSHLVLYLPLHIFDFLYVIVCLDLSSLLRTFSRSLKISQKHDYKNLTRIYKEITSVIENFDKIVGFLMFESFIYTSVYMYYNLITLLTNYSDRNYDDIIVIIYVISFVSFITKVECASRLNASSVLVKNESRDLKENNYKNVCDYIRFTKTCKEINMTVWGFLNLKRSIIFGTLGAILSYSLLIKNLINVN